MPTSLPAFRLTYEKRKDLIRWETFDYLNIFRFIHRNSWRFGAAKAGGAINFLEAQLGGRIISDIVTLTKWWCSASERWKRWIGQWGARPRVRQFYNCCGLKSFVSWKLQDLTCGNYPSIHGDTELQYYLLYHQVQHYHALSGRADGEVNYMNTLPWQDSTSRNRRQPPTLTSQYNSREGLGTRDLVVVVCITLHIVSSFMTTQWSFVLFIFFLKLVANILVGLRHKSHQPMKIAVAAEAQVGVISSSCPTSQSCTWQLLVRRG